MTNYINDAEEPQFLFEENFHQFERIFQKMTEMEETINQMKIKMKAQDDLIDVLYTKQADSKVLKKEIKLLKDNLVNQCELMEDVKNLKESMTNNKEDQIKGARDKVYNLLTDMVAEIISKQSPHTYINEDELGFKIKTNKITNSIGDLKFIAIEKTNAIIVEAINTIIDLNNPKQMLVLADIVSSIKAKFTSEPNKNRRMVFAPHEQIKHEFLQNFINRLFNCPAKDGHRITNIHLNNFVEM